MRKKDPQTRVSGARSNTALSTGIQEGGIQKLYSSSEGSVSKVDEEIRVATESLRRWISSIRLTLASEKSSPPQNERS